MALAGIGSAAEAMTEDVARRGRIIHKSIREFQNSFSALERVSVFVCFCVGVCVCVCVCVHVHTHTHTHTLLSLSLFLI